MSAENKKYIPGNIRKKPVKPVAEEPRPKESVVRNFFKKKKAGKEPDDSRENITKEIEKIPRDSMFFITMCCALAYAAIWLFLSLPYRPFPSEDTRVWLPMHSLCDLESMRKFIIPANNPVFLASLIFFKVISCNFSTALFLVLVFSVKG